MLLPSAPASSPSATSSSRRAHARARSTTSKRSPIGSGAALLNLSPAAVPTAGLLNPDILSWPSSPTSSRQGSSPLRHQRLCFCFVCFSFLKVAFGVACVLHRGSDIVSSNDGNVVLLGSCKLPTVERQQHAVDGASNSIYRLRTLPLDKVSRFRAPHLSTWL